MNKNIISKLFLISSLFLFAFSISSCEKCKNCTKTTDTEIDGIRRPFSETIEVCGKKRDFDAYEKLEYVCED